MCAGILTRHGLGQSSQEVRSITLEEAKAKAAAGGTAISNVALLGIDAARYHRQAVQADYFPKLGADFINLHYNKFLGQTIQLFRRDASLPLVGKDQTAVVLTLVQPVTQLLQVRQAVAVARADEEIARAKGAQMVAQMSENVERSYFGLLIAQRHQLIAQKKVERMSAGSQLVTPVAMGVGKTVEGPAALVEASKELIVSDSEVEEWARSLNALIGFPRDTKLILAAPEPVAETVSLSQATQQAVTNSPEVVEAEQTLAKAKAASRLSKLEYVPGVAIVGAYVNQPQAVIPALPSDFSFIGFTATFNIFDFGKREKTISERHAQVEMAEAGVAMIKTKIAATVQKSFLDLQRTQKLRDLTRRLAAGYEEAALENSPARAAAEVEMFQAEMDYRSALTQLKRLMDGR
jgi:outer membrane protein TolC